MKIYSMTATFGKLEHEQLTLQPGLNVLCAPNEWGKSTWCAFLLAMLYGLDTRSKTTRAALAEKERYAPWSGSPMEGRIDLNWNGRDITIERSTKGRIPLGDFHAYETATGLEVPELTAFNCGQQLLGVEQSVFRRAGFIRLADLPVTQDEALRHRLNALVTTGDESGDAVRLAHSLRDLKNKIRYNRSGQLPQALQQRDALEEKLAQWEDLDVQSRKLRERLEENTKLLKDLENHNRALNYRSAQADERRVSEARALRDQQVQKMEALEKTCAALPARETVEDKCRLLRGLNQQWNSLQSEIQNMPKEPVRPETPIAFLGLTPEKAADQADADAEAYKDTLGKGWIIMLALGLFCMLSAVALAWGGNYIPAILDLILGILGFTLGLLRKLNNIRVGQELVDKYGTPEYERWHPMAVNYGGSQWKYEKDRTRYQADRENLEEKMESVFRQRYSLCADRSPDDVMEEWLQLLAQWDALLAARKNAEEAEDHLETLMAMAKRSAPPSYADNLTCSPEETEAQILEAREEQQRLQSRREQYRSRMDSLGTGEDLRRQLKQARERAARLESMYEALTIAQETLAEATADLQRRFAPRITQRALELLNGMTGGRYDRLVIAEDFSLRAGARQEDTLHDALWRSDGTVDQLYLALRLAVSEELTPNAPLILDDALVRFDDTRMKAAMHLLQEMADGKQIILFTCQQREAQAIAKA